MLRTWRFNGDNLHIVADPHFHHDQDFIYEARGYSSMEEHDEGIIKIWNERVKPTDTVLCNGDFMFNATLDLATQYIKRLNGHIYYTWGNHNSGVKMLYRVCWWRHIQVPKPSPVAPIPNVAKLDIPYEVYPLTWNDPITCKPRFTFVGDYMTGKIDHTEFVMMHYAIRTWDRMGKGAVHICGHSHGNDPQSNPTWLEDRRCDFGIENFGGPIAWKDALAMFETKKFSKTDHHNENTTSTSF